MRIDGKNYYLTREESLALAANDIYPNEEVLQRRNDFFEEIDRTFSDIHIDPNGNIFARIDELDVSGIIDALKCEAPPRPKYAKERYGIKSSVSFRSNNVERNILYNRKPWISDQRKTELPKSWDSTRGDTNSFSFVAA